MKKNKTLLIGMVFSIFVNLAFFVENYGRPFSNLHFIVGFSFPMFMLWIFIGIMVFVKMILRGDCPIADWDRKQALDVLSNSSSLFQKTLAQLYLLIDKPFLFTVGWIFGFGLFMLVYAFKSPY
jgi:hypothetical protein